MICIARTEESMPEICIGPSHKNKYWVSCTNPFPQILINGFLHLEAFSRH